MRKRTLAREYALQALYTADINGSSALDCLDSVINIEGLPDPEVLDFARRLLRLAEEHREEIDSAISKFASNWPLDRMAVVDRNILRLGTAELLFAEDIPPKVSINEAVELAKKYGEEEAYKFVNGILDRIRKELCPTK